MPLTYSTDCEELAYVKDAAALRKAADHAIGADAPGYEPSDELPELGCAPPNVELAFSHEVFFQAGERFAGHDVVWFTWHGDDYRTGLLFVGTEAEVLSRLRQLPERSDM